MSFVIHLPESAISSNLHGDLCNLGVQQKYGTFRYFSDISNPTDDIKISSNGYETEVFKI